MSFDDCAYVDGGGKEQFERAQMIAEANIKTLVFVDSDNQEVNKQKPSLINRGIAVLECSDGLCIEQQVFQDLPWKGVLDLLEAVPISVQQKENLQRECVSSGDSAAIRSKLAESSLSKKHPWFKRIDLGEKLGDIIFAQLDDMPVSRHLKAMIETLCKWIDE